MTDGAASNDPCYNIPMSKPDFRGQADDEEVQFIFHRHWSTMLSDVFMAILLLLVSVMPTLIWRNYVWSFYFPLAGVLITLIIIMNAWLKWYFTIYIVTDQRVRQQLQRSLFKKITNDIYLNKIMNISYNASGLWGSLFGYGNITVQTATGDMLMTKVEKGEDNYNRLSRVTNKFGDSVKHDEGDYGKE